MNDTQHEPTRGERRQRRLDKREKMTVTGRSALLLWALSIGRTKRRQVRRKRGAR